MNELLTHIWNYDAILAHLRSGNPTGALEVAESAKMQCDAILQDYEARFESEAEAEAAWNEHGAQLMRDLNAIDADSVPF